MSSTKKILARNKLDGKTYRCSKEDGGTVFVYAPKMKRYGWRLMESSFNEKYEVIPEKVTPTEKWHKRIRSVLKKLEASGLWPELIPLYNTLLQVTWEDLAEMRSEYWDHHPDHAYKSVFANKYPFAYTITDEGGSSLKWDYVTELADCKTKSMYFGWQNGRIKNLIHKALEDKKDYSSGRIQVSYDVTFEYSAGKQKAWYSEEYRNCGNGHYYLAVDHNTAVFCEDD